MGLLSTSWTTHGKFDEGKFIDWLCRPAMTPHEVEKRIAKLDSAGRDSVIQSGTCFCGGRIVSRLTNSTVGKPDAREVYCRKCGVTYHD